MFNKFSLGANNVMFTTTSFRFRYVYLQQQIIKMMQENVEEKIQLEDMFKLTDDKIEEYWGQSSAPRSYHKDNLYFDFL